MSKTKSKNMRDHANELADKLAPHVESARIKAAPMIAEARERTAPVIAEARERTAPMVAEARGKAAPALSEAKDKLTHEVLPVITAAIAAATEATEEAREEARKRGAATAAALKGEIEAPHKKEKHRLRNFLVLLGLGGIAFFVAKKLSDREATTAWQSSYQPTPASTPSSPTTVDDTPTATAAAAATGAGAGAPMTESDDSGAAGPDEAAADAMEMPHAATTPDRPADEVHLKKDGPDVP